MTSQERRWKWILTGLSLLVMGYAILSRIVGNAWGFPHFYNDDEWHIVVRAMRMVETGDLNPHFFNYPSLLFYLQAAGIAGYSFCGQLFGMFDSFQDIPVQDGYYIARSISAIMALSTVFLVFYTGRRWFHPVAGLASAWLLSISFLHVRNGHYGLTDVPLAFWIALTLFLMFRMLDTAHGIRYHILTGMSLGCVGATKYNGGLFALIVLGSILLAPGSRKIWKTCLVGVTSGLTFLLASPYAVLDFRNFYRAFTFEFQHYRQGHVGFTVHGSPWGEYVNYLIIDWGLPAMTLIGFGGILLLISVIRCGLDDAGCSPAQLDENQRALYCRRRRVMALALVLFPVLYMLMLGRMKAVFYRNLCCILPSLALWGGIAIWQIERAGTRIVRSMTWVRGMLLTVLLILTIRPAAVAWQHSFDLRKPQSYQIAADWLTAHCRQVKTPIPVAHFSYLGLPLSAQFQREYVVTYPMWETIFNPPRNMMDRAPWEEYQRRGIRFLIVSEWLYLQNAREPAWKTYFDGIIAHGTLIHQVPGKYSMYWKPWPVKPHAYPGPTLSIYSFPDPSTEPASSESIHQIR